MKFPPILRSSASVSFPNTELAEAAGLAIEGGIVVDAFSRTSDPDIFRDRRLRRPRGAWISAAQNPAGIGSERARTGARRGRVIVGKPLPPAVAPWFWSDQYDLKLQMAGISDGYEKLAIRGSTEGSSFIAFYLRGAG